MEYKRIPLYKRDGHFPRTRRQWLSFGLLPTMYSGNVAFFCAFWPIFFYSDIFHDMAEADHFLGNYYD